MRYPNVVKAEFISRPNRFTAIVRLDSTEEIVHVKNTGRCRELLIPGVTVYLAKAENPLRKTRYDLIAVEKMRSGREPLLINMDSQIPNHAAEEWIRSSPALPPEAVIRREVTYRNSRFDFMIEDNGRKICLEVKGVTLENDGIAMFPDAPTLRGVKHLQELTIAVAEGLEAWVLFVVQMQDITLFRPNNLMHPEFGEALRQAAAAGVKIMAYGCTVSPDEIKITYPVPVEL